MPEHKNLTGADLHEPKGAELATAGQILIADGLGGTAWENTGIRVQGEMLIVGNTTPEVTPTAVDPTLNTDSDYTKVITSWSAGHIDGGFVFNTNELVVPYSGEYRVDGWANIKCANAQKVAMKYAINATPPYSTRKLIGYSTAANDYVTVAGMAYVTLTANDTVSFFIATDIANDPIIEEAGLIMHLIEEA